MDSSFLMTVIFLCNLLPQHRFQNFGIRFIQMIITTTQVLG